jgi:hypothetical protein
MRPWNSICRWVERKFTLAAENAFCRRNNTSSLAGRFSQSSFAVCALASTWIFPPTRIVHQNEGWVPWRDNSRQNARGNRSPARTASTTARRPTLTINALILLWEVRSPPTNPCSCHKGMVLRMSRELKIECSHLIYSNHKKQL